MAKEFADLERNLVRELNNFNILREDSERTRPAVLAPDCCDIIEFIHIEKPDVEQIDYPYVEGIRRYFSQNERLLVVPWWAYEFLSYMHRVVIENIGTYGSAGGLDRFLAQHDEAIKFLDLWKSRDFKKAERLFDHKKRWTQILNLAHDENFEYMVGDPIRRFNVLAKTKLVPVSSFVDGALGKDADIFNGVMSHLRELRPRTDDTFKNCIDAESFACLAWLNAIEADEQFAAVTASQDPRNAYYKSVLGDEDIHQFSLVWSPIALWMRSRVKRAVGNESGAYAARAADLINEILAQLRRVECSVLPAEIAPADAMSPGLIDSFRERNKLRGLLDEYDLFFRAPIITPISARARNPGPKRELKLLGFSEIAEAMKPGEFEQRMRRAAISLRAETEELISVARPFTGPAAGSALGASTLDELVTKMARDFEKNVY